MGCSINYADTLGRYSENNGYVRFFYVNGVEAVYSPVRLKGIAETSPTFCDLNSDNLTDMIVMSYSNLNSGSQQSHKAYLYCWTFPDTEFGQSTVCWPMYAHDRYRTNQYGFIPPDEPVGIQPVSNVVPEKFELHQNFPNPFNPSTTIRFDVRTAGNISLTVYDVLGREVEVIVNEFLKSGSYSVQFSGDNLPSGVYYYELRAESFSETKRMLLVK